MESTELQNSDTTTEESPSLIESPPAAVGVAPNSQIEVIPRSQEEWAWSEEIKGTGEMPEYFKKEKYKNVGAQAQALIAFEKRLGGFTGAPDEYEVEISEELQKTVDIDMESEEFKAFETFAREKHMSNDIFNDLVNRYLQNFAHTEEIPEEVKEQHRTDEMEKLGERGTHIVDEVSSWARNNLSETEFESFRGLADSAENVLLLQKLIGKRAPMKVDAKQNATPEFNRDDLREMLKDPRYQQAVPGFREMVDAKYKQLAESGRLGTKNAVGM